MSILLIMRFLFFSCLLGILTLSAQAPEGITTIAEDPESGQNTTSEVNNTETTATTIEATEESTKKRRTRKKKNKATEPKEQTDPIEKDNQTNLGLSDQSITNKKVFEKKQQKIKLIKDKRIKVDNRNFVGEINYLVKSIKRSLFSRFVGRKYDYLKTGIPIISFESTPNLKYTHQNFVINKLRLITRRNFYFIESFETLNFKTKVEKGNIIVTKGVQSQDELIKILSQYNSKYYAVAFLELLKKRHLSLYVQFIDGETGKIVLALKATVRVGLKGDQTFSFLVGQERVLAGGLTTVETTISAAAFYGERIYGVGDINLFPRLGVSYDLTTTGLQEIFTDLGGQMLFNLNELFQVRQKNVTTFFGITAAYRLYFFRSGQMQANGELTYAVNLNILIERVLVGFDFSPQTFGQPPIQVMGAYLGFYL